MYDHPVDSIELIETHISWVLLAGEFAYKIKKPVNFGFLDFSTLDKRLTCCEQELRLNSRLAPDIYLDVIAISGTIQRPVLSADGEVFEYAIKMRQFPQSSQLDHMLESGELNEQHMDAIARMVAEFHRHIEVADDTSDFGNTNVVYQPIEENFTQIKEHLNSVSYAETLDQLQQWSSSAFEKLKPVIEQRKRDGFIRECHGDMHLRNLIWLNNRPMAFDCIEFNAYLRWIDVISEIAFLVMDLQGRKQHNLANRFLNTYLESTGDYAGLSLLPFYLCYRALVRAKVDALRAGQQSITEEEKARSFAEFESYLELAQGYTQIKHPKMMIMRGVSASGKSTVSKTLLEAMGAIRIRSDVERKRLFNIGINENTSNEIDSGLYSKQASQKTYEKLSELASQIIGAGYSVIVDATFLKNEQCEFFYSLAQRLDVPCIIVETTAPDEILRQRIRQRKNDVSDADLAVLEYQLAHRQPLSRSEAGSLISLDTSHELDMNLLVDKIKAIT